MLFAITLQIITLYDVINYNNITSATNPHVFVENVLLLIYRL